MVVWAFKTMINKQTACDTIFMNTSQSILTASHSVRFSVVAERGDGTGPILPSCSAGKMLYRI
jgi:hypothetical protein